MPFSKAYTESLSEHTIIHYFHIQEITPALETLIDEYIVSICN